MGTAYFKCSPRAETHFYLLVVNNLGPVFNTQQFRIMRFEDTVAKPDWNAGQKSILRMVAEK